MNGGFPYPAFRPLLLAVLAALTAMLSGCSLFGPAQQAPAPITEATPTLVNEPPPFVASEPEPPEPAEPSQPRKPRPPVVRPHKPEPPPPVVAPAPPPPPPAPVNWSCSMRPLSGRPAARPAACSPCGSPAARSPRLSYWT